MAVHDQDPYSQGTVDSDPEETAEWQESLDQLVDAKGAQRGREVMLSLLQRSKERRLGVPMVPTTDYVNTISAEDEAAFPGDEDLERPVVLQGPTPASRRLSAGLFPLVFAGTLPRYRR